MRNWHFSGKNIHGWSTNYAQQICDHGSHRETQCFMVGAWPSKLVIDVSSRETYRWIGIGLPRELAELQCTTIGLLKCSFPILESNYSAAESHAVVVCLFIYLILQKQNKGALSSRSWMLYRCCRCLHRTTIYVFNAWHGGNKKVSFKFIDWFILLCHVLL